MNRSFIGNWGEGLDAGRQARAVATLGVLQGNFDVVPAEIARDPETLARILRATWGQRPERLRFGGYDRTRWKALQRRLPPEIAADAWLRLLDQGLPGPAGLNLMVVAQYMDDREAARSFAWLNDLLTRHETGIDGLFFERWLNTKAPRRQHARTTWHWPIRLGFLADPASRALRQGIDAAKPYWLDRLTRLLDVEATGEGSDILVSPLPLADTARVVAHRALRATAVLLVEQPAFTSESDALALQRLFAVAEASAAAMLQSGGRHFDMVLSLVHEISHDLALDAALARAARYVTDTQPLLVAERDFIARSRIGGIAEALAHRFEARRMTEVATVARSLARDAYVSEGGTASELADMVAAHAPELAAPQPRFLQAATWLFDEGEAAVRPAAGFARLRPHLLDVHIAPLAEDETSALEAFPDSRIDWREGRQELIVVLTAPGCRVAASLFRGMEPIEPGPLDRETLTYIQAAWGRGGAESRGRETAFETISIQPSGPSDRARFVLIPEEGERVRARLLVVHTNRILQTAILDGPIEEASPPVEGETTASSIRLLPEGVVRASLEELDERRPFDMALLTNDSLTGTPQLTAIAGEHVVLRDLGEVKAIAPRIRNLLMRVVDAPEGYADADSPELLDLLLSLAREGVLIRRYLKDAGLGPFLADPGTRPTRLQLVAAKPEEVLPLEFVYDGPVPRRTAELCPNRQDALEAGSCGDCPNRRGKDHVCPMRFWGFRQVIERQLYRAETTPLQNLVGRGDPILDRARLPRPTAGLFARSRRAERFPGGADAIALLLARLRATSGGASDAVEDWRSWEERVGTLSPTLLVLLPHTDLALEGEVLEIGAGDRIANAEIDEAIVGDCGRPVIVLLLGCDTGSQEVRYASFAAQFRHAGCAIVIATLTPVLGRHAAPIAEALVAEFDRHWHDLGFRATLGDAMAAMRRRFMAMGLPSGLALVAYGDADWLLGG